MKENDVRHIRVLEFPKQMLWTDRDLEYFLEEMPSEACRMNNDVYDVLIKTVKAGEDYSLEEAFNLAYYECVRISLAKYPESKDLHDVLEMDIQHNQSHVDYDFTILVMNMVWAMLRSTGTAQRFANKLHSYLDHSIRLKFGFRSFFTPNDVLDFSPFPYEEKEEPRYNLRFAPCPKEMDYETTTGEWRELTAGYKEHLIEELLMLWPEDRREYVRKCIMEEKARQMKPQKEEKPQSHTDTEQQLEDHGETEQLRKELDDWKRKYGELEKKCLDLESRQEPEQAFNAQTGAPCFTSRQMGILLTAVGRMTEKDNPPGKTTIGDIVEKISGYKATAASANMRGAIPPADTEAVAKAIESRYPNLAAEVRKL